MASYSSWNGSQLHANFFLLTEILKGKLGFQGFVVSDWEGIDRLCQPQGSDYRHCISASVNAGVDMIMVPFGYQKFFEDLLFLVESGEIPMSRIDDAVRCILRVKFVAGLFENPFSDRSLLGTLGCKEHRLLAREAVRRSLVLLKNDKNMKEPFLPLDKNARRVLVAGTHADNLGYQCGGWTITWYGGSGRITIGFIVNFDYGWWRSRYKLIWHLKYNQPQEPVSWTPSEKRSERRQVVYEKRPSEGTFVNQEFSFAIVVVGGGSIRRIPRR